MLSDKNQSNHIEHNLIKSSTFQNPPFIPWKERYFNVHGRNGRDTPSNDTEIFLPTKQKKFVSDFGNSCGQSESGGRLPKFGLNFASSSILKETGNTTNKPESSGIGGTEGIVTRARARSFYVDVENRINQLSFIGKYSIYSKGIIEYSLWHCLVE